MTKAKSLMVLGTASGVGKSFLTAGICRLLSDWGYRVAPFKAQNMSNNSFVTDDGKEMGRAQVVQAECARLRPHVDMNPVLLKPATDNRSQVVIHGRSIGHYSAYDYFQQKEIIAEAIRSSYERLASEYEILVIEGAGSPAEVNLRENDLVNMRMAEMADAACLLVADIDRGGVFASLIGTLDLLEPRECERIVGLVINKFRGDLRLFDGGLDFLRKRTGKEVWGVLPYDRELWLEEEDTLSLEVTESTGKSEGALDIAVLLLPRLSNFTDFEVLRREEGVCLRYIKRVEELGHPDLLVLPGTKATLDDYDYLVAKGFRDKILRFAQGGGRLLGICGGYQMMGKVIRDPGGIESEPAVVEGLGFFHMTTEFTAAKVLRQVKQELDIPLFGHHITGEIYAYEIHMGRTRLHEAYPPFGPEGAIHPSGRMAGTYFHGVWDSASFRASFLRALAEDCGKPFKGCRSSNLGSFKENHYARLARLVAENLKLDLLRDFLPFEPQRLL